MDWDSLFMGLALLALFAVLVFMGKKPPGNGPKP